MQCREERVEPRRETRELEQVFVGVHQPPARIGEGEEKAPGGDVRCGR